MITESTLLENRYFDSVFLMRVSKRLSEQPGINYAALIMGTPKNIQILADAGYDGIDGLGASSNDLVVSLKADSSDEARLVVDSLEQFLVRDSARPTTQNVRSLEQALTQQPDSNIALVSVPGEFAAILEMEVSALTVGIPEQDIDDLKEIVSDLSALSGTSEDKVDKYRRGVLNFGEYLKPLLDSKLNGSGDDLLATLAKAKHHNLYSEEEVLSNAAIALTAGRGTSVNLICNGLLAFARHPKQWESLASDPTEMAIKSAVEECLRYDSPQQSLDRIASRDIELRGQRIRSGEKVRCYIGSANRDHMKFENADNFEINRTPNQHVAFGWGIHHCLGSSVSQVEFQEIISALLSRNLKPSLISPTVEYEPTTNLRSLTRLDMQLG